MKVDELIEFANQSGHLSPNALPFFKDKINQERLSYNNLFSHEMNNVKEICHLLNISWFENELWYDFIDRVLETLLVMQKDAHKVLDASLGSAVSFDADAVEMLRRQHDRLSSLSYVIGVAIETQSRDDLRFDAMRVVIGNLVERGGK